MKNSQIEKCIENQFPDMRIISSGYGPMVSLGGEIGDDYIRGPFKNRTMAVEVLLIAALERAEQESKKGN